MVMTIDVPEKVVERAAELGVPVDTLVNEAFDAIVRQTATAIFVQVKRSSVTREEAGKAIREIARTHTLGGIRLKDLIEEGRH